MNTATDARTSHSADQASSAAGREQPPPHARGDTVDRVLLAELLTDRDGPCLSVLLPTERAFPASQQNPVRLRNLIREAAARFDAGSAVHAEALLAPLRELADDDLFWRHPADGLALYSAPGYWRAIRTPGPLPERAMVNASFLTKPLLRFLQDGRFQVLALSRTRIALYEGDGRMLRAIEPPPGVPRTLEDALGTEIRERDADNYAYDGPGGRGKEGSRVAGGSRAGSNAQAQDKDTERFFRAVDRAVSEHLSSRSRLPLVLAALPEHQSLYRRVSDNALLAAQGIELNPDALSADELRSQAAAALRPQFEARVRALCDRYGAAQGAGRGDDRLQEIAVAAAAGRVDCLLMEAERQVPGRFDPASGAFIASSEADEPGAEDLLDEIAERVLKLGGEVIVLSREEMPSPTGLAAIYRY